MVPFRLISALYPIPILEGFGARANQNRKAESACSRYFSSMDFKRRGSLCKLEISVAFSLSIVEFCQTSAHDLVRKRRFAMRSRRLFKTRQQASRVETRHSTVVENSILMKRWNFDIASTSGELVASSRCIFDDQARPCPIRDLFSDRQNEKGRLPVPSVTRCRDKSRGSIAIFYLASR